MSMETYCEYSRSNRATCRRCNTKIEKGVLRMGRETCQFGEFPVTRWWHLHCFFLFHHQKSL